MELAMMSACVCLLHFLCVYVDRVGVGRVAARRGQAAQTAFVLMEECRGPTRVRVCTVLYDTYMYSTGTVSISILA